MFNVCSVCIEALDVTNRFFFRTGDNNGGIEHRPHPGYGHGHDVASVMVTADKSILSVFFYAALVSQLIF